MKRGLSALNLVCPHINIKRAHECGSTYYCDRYNAEFECMNSFCESCNIYGNMMLNGLAELRAAINFENRNK